MALSFEKLHTNLSPGIHVGWLSITYEAGVRDRKPREHADQTKRLHIFHHLDILYCMNSLFYTCLEPGPQHTYAETTCTHTCTYTLHESLILNHRPVVSELLVLHRTSDARQPKTMPHFWNLHVLAESFPVMCFLSSDRTARYSVKCETASACTTSIENMFMFV